ncbi:ATP-binding protein [Bacillus sp. EB600]|uniref:ATP-binding protein n=1 Tax=Bacillus sp. EB600 TaxID=2806345 RepID=UPI0028119A9A|nr:ATP-binding protein [Bacillus sp. EB600]
MIPPYIGLWLLQIFCILFPMVIYQAFFQKKFMKKSYQKIGLTLLCGISILICITFPVSINEDYILDFRFIPLLIAFIYGGYRVGFCLSILLIAYRFMAGGTGFYLGGLWMTSFYLVSFHFILPHSGKWSQNWRKLYPYVLLTFSLIFFALGTQFLDDYSFTKQEIYLWVWFSILNYMTFWMIMYLQNILKDIEDVSQKVIQFEKAHTINHLLVYISQQLALPLSSAKEMISNVQKEQLTSHQAYSLRKIESDLTKAEQNLDQYLAILDENSGKQSVWSFVNELENIVDIMKLYAGVHQVELGYTSTAEEDVSLRGDRTMIRFALINLIKNAVEACKPKGRVNICLHEMMSEVYIVIEDNGVGIPSNVLTQLGKPLPTTKENGTGLGLVSTYKITKSMGGRVEVESTPNEGTKFNLYFPKWAV